MVPESYNLNWSDSMKIKARGAPCFRRTLTQSVRRRPVRELLGKIPTKDPDVIQEIYLSEMSIVVNARRWRRCRWVLRWSRSRQGRRPRRF